MGKLVWWHHGYPCVVAKAMMTATFYLRWQRGNQQHFQLAIGAMETVLAGAGVFLHRLGMVAGSRAKTRRTKRTPCPLGCYHLDTNEHCPLGVAQEPLNANKRFQIRFA